MTYHGKSKKMVLMALFTAQALVLYIVESIIPVPFIAPGAKLGLANIVTVSALYIFTPLKVLLIIFMRVMLASIFTGSILSMIYSLSGGLLSFLCMLIMKKTLDGKIGLIGISSAGAVFHNVGQLLVASIFISNIGIISYLPILSIVGMITGVFVGITSHYLLQSTRNFFVPGDKLI